MHSVALHIVEERPLGWGRGGALASSAGSAEYASTSDRYNSMEIDAIDAVVDAFESYDHVDHVDIAILM